MLSTDTMLAPELGRLCLADADPPLRERISAARSRVRLLKKEETLKIGSREYLIQRSRIHPILGPSFWRMAVADWLAYAASDRLQGRRIAAYKDLLHARDAAEGDRKYGQARLPGAVREGAA